VDEISSPEMTPGSPTPIVEETQQTTLVGMDMDLLEEGQGQQVEDADNHSHSMNPEEHLRVNGMVPNQEEMTALEILHTTTLEHP
jgi:hypothetical protein